jgi:hypothetical protein
MSVASQVPPSPLPDRAWNGRSWWFSCCSGCLLLLLVIAGLFFLAGGWSATYGARILDEVRRSLTNE